MQHKAERNWLKINEFICIKIIDWISNGNAVKATKLHRHWLQHMAQRRRKNESQETKCLRFLSLSKKIMNMITHTWLEKERSKREEYLNFQTFKIITFAFGLYVFSRVLTVISSWYIRLNHCNTDLHFFKIRRYSMDFMLLFFLLNQNTSNTSFYNNNLRLLNNFHKKQRKRICILYWL